MLKVKDIIKNSGLGDINNVRLQQVVGKRLADRGYRAVVRRLGGVAQRVWVLEDAVAMPNDVQVDAAINMEIAAKIHAIPDEEKAEV